MKRIASPFALLLGFALTGFASHQVFAQSTKPLISSIGIVDDAALSKQRSDFPQLAKPFLPAIAKQKKLSGIVFKSGLVWSTPTLGAVDVTAEVLAKVRSLPISRRAQALAPEQKEAVNKTILALTQLKAATSVSLRAWNDINTLRAIQDEVGQTKRRIEDRQPLTTAERLTLQFNRRNEDEATRRKDFAPLYAKWREAEQQLQKATQLARSSN